MLPKLTSSCEYLITLLKSYSLKVMAANVQFSVKVLEFEAWRAIWKSRFTAIACDSNAIYRVLRSALQASNELWLVICG